MWGDGGIPLPFRAMDREIDQVSEGALTTPFRGACVLGPILRHLNLVKGRDSYQFQTGIALNNAHVLHRH